MPATHGGSCNSNLLTDTHKVKKDNVKSAELNRIQACFLIIVAKHLELSSSPNMIQQSPCHKMTQLSLQSVLHYLQLLTADGSIFYLQQINI